MLQQRLRELEIKITELSEYLQISRPTLYKFIACYDGKKFNSIDKNILALFNYIDENELIGKKNVINYILTKMPHGVAEDDVSDPINTLKNYLLLNPESKKSKFALEYFFDDNFGEILCYFADIAPLLDKESLSTAEKEKLQPFYDLKNKIKNTEEK